MSDTPAEPASLAEALSLHQIELAPEIVSQIDAYREQLWEWNTKINLTRHTTFEKFVARDLMDTLQLSEQIPRGERVLDIGSGGGVPGLLLAIVRPDLQVAVSDSVAKKAQVLEGIVAALDLPVAVYASRAEQVLEVSTWDTLIARAVAPLKKILTWLEPHWDAFDRLLLVKGRNWVGERGEARHYGLLTGKRLRKVATYSSPGFGESVVLSVQRESEVE